VEVRDGGGVRRVIGEKATGVAVTLARKASPHTAILQWGVDE
jgi:hypothetical protein